MAHSPHAKDYREFLRIPGSIGEAPIILPLWRQDEVLDLRQVVYADMTDKQVHCWHLRPPVLLQQAGLTFHMLNAGP